MTAMLADNFALSAPHPSAIYLPAVTPGYVELTRQGQSPDRALPDGFDLADLAFWTGRSGLFNHKFCLHSIGSERVGTNFTSTLFDRTRGDYTVLGDSGGYQIGKGTMNGLAGLKKGQTGAQAYGAWTYENHHVREWIVNSLRTYFDYSMTIDMALWVQTNNGINSPFHNCSAQQLIEMTRANLRFIEERGLGKTKWLNVLQGTTPENSIQWWDAVKHFKHGGWAMASATGWRGGLHNMLMMLLLMRDEHAFEKGQDWVHMLGVSQPMWDMFFTACQRELRRDNSNLQFSYDASTPFMMAGMLDKYAVPPALQSDTKSWSVPFLQIDAVRSKAESDELAFAANTSPLGRLIKMRHLVVRDQPYESRRVDTISNQIVANHNIWVYLDASRRVYDVAFNSDRRGMPQIYADALGIVEEAFRVEDGMGYIFANKDLLDTVAPMQYKG